MKQIFVILTFFIFFMLPDIFLFPEKNLKVTDVRYPFFLLKKNPPEVSIRPSGIIYKMNGSIAGEYKLVSFSEENFLCRVSRDFSGVDKSCFVKADPREFPVPGRIEKREPYPPGKDKNSLRRFIRINGIKFEERSDSIFLSVTPEHLTVFPELTFNGIRKFLERIDNNSREGYKCNLWSLEDFIEYKGKGRAGDVYLGLVEGRLNLIYWRSGRYNFQLIAEDTLAAVSNEIYVLFVLKGDAG
ncbi:MAG: hypothetical protein ABFR75_05390 [Acidobacteriota bacterium]